MFKYITGITTIAFTAVAFTACDDSSSAKNLDDNSIFSSSSNEISNVSSSSITSSSEGNVDVSSSSITSSSEGNVDVSSSSITSSSSDKVCSKVLACDAMVKEDVSTWNFIRKDNFGDDMQYIYSVEEKTLVLTTIDSEGTKEVNKESYSMYDMTSEVSQEMAFMAAVSTCEDGGGNDREIEVCK